MISAQQFTTLLTESRPGVYLFFSFDLVNSTQFKASHPTIWPVVANRFYELISAEFTTRLSSALVWKFVGDEVLFYKQVGKIEDLQSALPAAYDVLQTTMEVLHKNFKESQELLAVKGTVWIAEAGPVIPSDAGNIPNPFRNIIVNTGSYRNENRDFLGPEIDAGFRISKFALRQRLVVSAELACVLLRLKILENNLRIVTYEPLKGVWGGRHYPIIWFENNWDEISESFLFDEHLVSTLAARVKTGLPDDSKISMIEKVFADLGRADQVNTLMRSIEAACVKTHPAPIEIEIPKERTAEIHCVAICFSPDGLVLAARRPPTKRRFPNALEFGCGQLKLGESFSACLIRAYKDDFGVNLKFGERAIPIATFEIHDSEEKRVIPGIIFIAEITNPEVVEHNFSRKKHGEIVWINPEKFDLSNDNCVPDFEATLKTAFERWKVLKQK